jgi:molybdopterin molybdotransferase
MGAEILFHKVKIKPGKPVLLAKWRDTFIVGLPGNPASAQVTFSLFAAPLIRSLAGDTRPLPHFRSAPLLETYRQAPGRKCFVRAHLNHDGVRVLSNQSSGASTSIAWSNALAIFDEDVQEVPAGDVVSVFSLSDL